MEAMSEDGRYTIQKNFPPLDSPGGPPNHRGLSFAPRIVLPPAQNWRQFSLAAMEAMGEDGRYTIQKNFPPLDSPGGPPNHRGLSFVRDGPSMPGRATVLVMRTRGRHKKGGPARPGPPPLRGPNLGTCKINLITHLQDTKVRFIH